jgi:hypothetical protein
MSFEAKVWQTLSAINVNEHTEKKGNLTYLSWAWAFTVLKNHFPESSIKIKKEQTFSDGTMEVRCEVTVKEGDQSSTQSMWLPVMDNRNNAITNPNARQINDARMRCVTKCLGLHGLGLYIYAGQELPEPEAEVAKKPLTKDEMDNLLDLLDATETDLDQFMTHYKVKKLDELRNGKYQNAISVLAKKMEKIVEVRNAAESA